MDNQLISGLFVWTNQKTTSHFSLSRAYPVVALGVYQQSKFSSSLSYFLRILQVFSQTIPDKLFACYQEETARLLVLIFGC